MFMNSRANFRSVRQQQFPKPTLVNALRRHSAGLAIIFIASLGLTITAGVSATGQPRVYVADQCSNTVKVIDTATNTVVTTVATGAHPSEVAITPDGTRAYVTNQNPSGFVSVINTATNTVVTTIPVGGAPFAIAITPDGTRAYVANEFSDSVSVIDTATNSVVVSVPVGAYPTGVAITPGGTRAYVTNYNSGTVSVIDTTTNTVVATVLGVANAFLVAITPDGTGAYVTSDAGPVSVINTATNTVVTTIPVGPATTAVAFTPSGARAYVANQTSNNVSVIDTATNTVVTAIPVGLQPYAVAITPDGTRAYVANYSSNTLSIIDTATNTVVNTISSDGSCPVGLALNNRVTVTAPQLSALGPAQVWVGLKNSDDVGTKFDLLAEVLKNGVLIGTGQLNDVSGGSSGFNNAKLDVINMTLSAPVGFGPGDNLSIRLSVRIAASSGHRSGTARLWFNDAAANSRFSATIGGVTSTYFLRPGSALSNAAGPGPKTTMDVLVDRAVGGNPFKPFGTWSITL